jgi:zinc-finger binding domain of transposase IS66
MLEYVPASFVVIRHVRTRLSCTKCDCIVQAAAPSRPIERSVAGPGKRNPVNTYTFMRDVYDRMPWSWQPQLTTDGWGRYRIAIENTFHSFVDYAMLIKVYGNLPRGREGYAPPRFTEAVSKVICREPDKRHISTGYIERQNLTLRMMSCRFTRLTNAFLQKD